MVAAGPVCGNPREIRVAGPDQRETRPQRVPDPPRDIYPPAPGLGWAEPIPVGTSKLGNIPGGAAGSMTTEFLPTGLATCVADGAVPLRALISPELPKPPRGPRAAITVGWARDEAEHVRALLGQARLPEQGADVFGLVPGPADGDRRARAARRLRQFRADQRAQGHSAVGNAGREAGREEFSGHRACSTAGNVAQFRGSHGDGLCPPQPWCRGVYVARRIRDALRAGFPLIRPSDADFARVAAHWPGGYHLVVIRSAPGQTRPGVPGHLARSEGATPHLIAGQVPRTCGRCRDRQPA